MRSSSPPASQINWLFLDDEEMRAARKIIAQAGQESTIDVLDLGQPIEVISDQLFPGTSTLHTELRYVIFVPALLYAMREQSGIADPFKTMRKKEAELGQALVNGDEKLGVIGRTRGEALKYPPSTTYWTAVNSYRTLGTTTYERGNVLESLGKRAEGPILTDDGDGVEGALQSFAGNKQFRTFSLQLFSNVPKLAWNDKLTFALRPIEARFLREQIQQYHPNSLYSDLLRAPATKIAATGSIFDFKVQRPELANLLHHCDLYSHLAMGITTAYRWALCGHFAAIRTSTTAKTEWRIYQDRNRRLFAQWILESKGASAWKAKEFSAVMTAAYSTLPGLDPKLLAFIEKSQDILNAGGKLEGKLETLGKLVREREFSIKKHRSRFEDPSVSIPENVKPEEAQPLEPHLFSYRWRWGRDNALTILSGMSGR